MMPQRNYLHIRSDLSHASLQWAIEAFHKRADQFELEIHPLQADLAYSLAKAFPGLIKLVTTRQDFDPDEWYVTATISWGSPGMPKKEVT